MVNERRDKAVLVMWLNWSDPGSCFSRRVQQQRADSPGPSCVSMKSDFSMDIPATFKDGNQSIEKR